ncbi:uncharacterized protein LOC144343495 [Saccoglossus kowalevskii]
MYGILYGTLTLVASVYVFAQDETPCEGRYVFQCNTGECFPTYLKCDGHRSCPGGEDEKNCGLHCRECSEWYNIEDGCTVIPSKYKLPCAEESNVCITRVKKVSKKLRYWRGCFSAKRCAVLESENPPECYADPITVGSHCVFCCEGDYCNDHDAEDAVIG